GGPHQNETDAVVQSKRCRTTLKLGRMHGCGRESVSRARRWKNSALGNSRSQNAERRLACQNRNSSGPQKLYHRETEQQFPEQPRPIWFADNPRTDCDL